MPITLIAAIVISTTFTDTKDFSEDELASLFALHASIYQGVKFCQTHDKNSQSNVTSAVKSWQKNNVQFSITVNDKPTKMEDVLNKILPKNLEETTALLLADTETHQEVCGNFSQTIRTLEESSKIKENTLQKSKIHAGWYISTEIKTSKRHSK
ncbi:hypothetical protein [Chitinilyticum piscinae]|uniref:Uncharacterized protein n=1 Tax=Chitinilyticum piscinae TaxID=2866724 RepID=A0A8J7KDF5_9NEIS|nr:hypothetical protein [Chitinilyticum piscinae]MBE9608724.1 hypothetical protein [Chitinilyticum piscinae]